MSEIDAFSTSSLILKAVPLSALVGASNGLNLKYAGAFRNADGVCMTLATAACPVNTAISLATRDL